MARTFSVELKTGVTRDEFRESFLSAIYHPDTGIFQKLNSRPETRRFYFSVEPTEKDTHDYHVHRANIVVTFGNDDSYYHWSAFSPTYVSRLGSVALDSGASMVSS